MRHSKAKGPYRKGLGGFLVNFTTLGLQKQWTYEGRGIFQREVA